MWIVHKVKGRHFHPFSLSLDSTTRLSVFTTGTSAKVPPVGQIWAYLQLSRDAQHPRLTCGLVSHQFFLWLLLCSDTELWCFLGLDSQEAKVETFVLFLIVWCQGDLCGAPSSLCHCHPKRIGQSNSPKLPCTEDGIILLDSGVNQPLGVFLHVPMFQMLSTSDSSY